MDSVSTLAAAAAGGDPAATSELLERIWPDAFRVAWSIIGERAAAQDAAQDACARVLTSIVTLRNSDSFTGWFYRIVVNEAKRRIRRTARSDALADRASPEGLPAEDRLDLQRALQALAPDLRSAVVLHYYVGLTSSQIAAIAGVSPLTVRWRLFVARGRLRPLLGAEPAPSPSTPNAKRGYNDEPQAVR